MSWFNFVHGLNLSGAPAREMGNHPFEKIWLKRSYARTLFAGEGRESGISPSGGGVCYKPRDAFVQPAFFVAGNCTRNGVAVVAFKNMFTSTASLHKDFVTVVLSFQETVSKKLLWQQTIADLIQTICL